MSARNVASSAGAARRNVNPSSTDRSPARRIAPVGGTAGSRNSAYSAAVNVITSTRYAAANPCQAITAAPSNGPAVKPRLNAAWLSVFAAGSNSGRISRGMIADRAGLLTAKHAD